MSSEESAVPPKATPGSTTGRSRIWLVGLSVVWAVLLGVLAVLSVGRDEPTVREQRSLTQAVPVVYRALGDLVAAAGPDVVVELTAAEVAEGCRVTPFRDGATLEQAVIFRTADAPALLDRIAQRLPADYRPVARHDEDGAHTFRADAGEFVAIRGSVTELGVLTLTASTGCRPTDGTAIADDLLVSPVDDEPARVLDALGATEVEVGERASAVHQQCRIVTARATGRGDPSQDLGDALRPLVGADAVVVADEPDRYAYRSGSRSVVVETTGHDIRVAVTSSC